MLKTKPSWMNWKNKGGNNVSTGSSRVDAQNGEGADVMSAPDPDVLLKKIMDGSGFDSGVRKKPVRIPSKGSNNVTKNMDLEDIKYMVDDAVHHGRVWYLGRGRHKENLQYVDKSFDYEYLRNRKLSSTLSLLFGKIAEERMGDRTEGADKWDIDKIMFRRISKKVITDCKYAREKQRLVLMLDSSPSCSSMANVYSQISTESANFDDLEIYDAPNGYAHSIYNPRDGKFTKLTREEVEYTMLWGGFSGRTIIYFGDTDAARSIRASCKYNDIHWFYRAYDDWDLESQIIDTERLRTKWSDRATIYMCNDIPQLMQAVRDMR